ncbi:methylmalonyl-CoA epimerase [Pseudogracilibacillus sp. SO30301A]|uniref:methylmalonyl-CoA epimerase n=1 Tax=Pseudogracilibacillus sp. SO30301A TaxID=3098291 RepID=UPI00300DEA5B
MELKNGTFEAPEKIAHIGIAVHNIENSLAFYNDLLGLTLENVEEVESEQVKVAFLKIGESRIELLEPISKESPIAKFLERKGEGIHHIALEVNDIEKRLLQLKTEGIRLINEQPKEGSNNSQIAFLHPKSTNGVLVELCQHY